MAAYKGTELLTVSETADRLGTSREYLRKLRRLARIEPCKVGSGRTLVFTRRQVEALQRAMLRHNPGHDPGQPRRPGRPRRSGTFSES
jgi:hypothetical protein